MSELDGEGFDLQRRFARSGDSAALVQLLQNYGPTLLAYLRLRLGDAAERAFVATVEQVVDKPYSGQSAQFIPWLLGFAARIEPVPSGDRGAEALWLAVQAGQDVHDIAAILGLSVPVTRVAIVRAIARSTHPAGQP